MNSALQAMEGDLRSRLERLEQSKNDTVRTENQLRAAPPRVILSLRDTSGLLSCRFKYPYTIPFCKVEEKANPNLLRTVQEFAEDDFLKQVHEDITIFNLKPGCTPPSTYDITFNRRLYKKLLSASGTALAGLIAGIALAVAPEAAPVIYVAGAAAGGVIGAASTNTVTVTFSARPCDIESLYMDSLAARKQNIESQIQALRQQLDEVLSQRNADLLVRLEQSLHFYQRQLTEVNEMLDFNTALHRASSLTHLGTFALLLLFLLATLFL